MGGALRNHLLQHSEFKDEAGAVQRLGNWFTISKADELAQDNSDPQKSQPTHFTTAQLSPVLYNVALSQSASFQRLNLVKGDYQRIKVFYIYKLRAR